MAAAGRLRRFRDCQNGTITVEALFWVILLILAVGLIADATTMFHSQSRVLRAAYDANRNLSIGRFQTTVEVEAFVESELGTLSPNIDAVSSVSDHVVTTQVTTPASDLRLFGFFSAFRDTQMTITASHYIEDYGT